jgi:DNA-binding NtrC family response regulator
MSTSGPARSLVFLCDASNDRRANLRNVAATAGCQVREVGDLATLASLARSSHPALIVIGLAPSREQETLAAVERLHAVDRRLPMVLVVESGSERLAVAALRAGVKDYFSEPIDYPVLTASIKRHLAVQRRSPDGSRTSPGLVSAPKLIGSSDSIQRVEAYLDKVAARDVTVLITGETGTGKELAAALIHARSRRRHGQFVAVNCAAIPEGLLESELFGHEQGAFTGAAAARPGLLQVADRGTAFLDEVGDMGLVAQAKVLRSIESRELYRVGGKKGIPFDVRVVAATNQDLERGVDEGRFRKDLFFRLNVARIHLPPLRERRSDIVSLLNHYLSELNARTQSHVEGFSDEAIGTLQAYDWPGNVRELKNLVEAIFVSPPERFVAIDDLPEVFRQRLSGVTTLPAAERKRLIEALFAANWNKSQAAELLHWSRMTVYRKMAKYSVLRSSEPRHRRRAT